MKVPILLALFAVAAYAQTASEREIQYAAYSEYVYEYKGQILSGLPELSKEFAGLKITAEVRLQIHSQNRFLMQLRNIQLCKIQKEVAMPTEQQTVLPAECQDDSFTTAIKLELGKRVEFYWTRGLISQISTTLADPAWAVNIKLGVLELFQVNLEGNPVTKNLPKTASQNEQYTVMEQGVGGECESIYNVKVRVSEPIRTGTTIIPEKDILKVTKVRNYENCIDRPTRHETVIYKGIICRDCQTGEEDRLLTQLGQVSYDITGNRKLFVIDHAVAEGKHIFEPFGKDNGQAVTFVNQRLVKIEARKIPAADDPEFIPNLDPTDHKDQTEGLKFVFPQEKPREVIQKDTHNVECKPMSSDHGLHGQIEQLLNNVVNGITEYISDESLTQLHLLIEKLRGLNRTELCHCMNHFGQDLVNDAELNEKRRKVLEDLLPLLGSLHSVEVLYRRIESRRIVGYRAAELISTLAYHPKPDDQILDTVLELCLSNAVNEDVQLKQTCWLAFGSLVHVACKAEDRTRCPVIKEERYMRELVAFTDRRQPEADRRMAFKAIGNAGIHFQNATFNLLESIKNIVRNEKDTETSPEIKAQAIYGLRRVSTKRPIEIQTILVPVFRDRTANHEVRIAAFVVIMDTQPDHLTIQMLAQTLKRETSREVGNFVYSYFKGMAESKIPCKKHISLGAKEAIRIIKKFENGLQYSKCYHWEKSILKKSISAAINMNWISSPESSYGIGGSGKLSAKVMGRNMNILEWGYRSEHMEELYQQMVFKVKGVYPPIDKKFSDEKNKQTLTTREGTQTNDLKDLVKRIDTEVNVTERHPKTQPMSATFFLKAYGREIRYFSFDRATIEQILAGQNTALRDLEVELSANKPQMKYQKAFILGQGWQMWPTTVGIPLHLNISDAGLMAIDVTGKVTMQPELQQVLQDFNVKAKTVDASGIVNPRLGLRIVGKMGVSLNHVVKAGVGYEAMIQSSALVDGTFKLDIEKLKVESAFKAPKHDHTAFSAKCEPYTFGLTGEEMPKQYAAHSGNMVMMAAAQNQQPADNAVTKKVIDNGKPKTSAIEIGDKTVVAKLSSTYPQPETRNCWLMSDNKCYFAGRMNAIVVVRPGTNNPDEIEVVGKISDWVVTPKQYEQHIRRSSRRQYLEPKDQTSSQSGSRSFTSADTFKKVKMPGPFYNSKELALPPAIPASLEERISKEKFDFDTAYWTKEDDNTVPLTSINNNQQQQQQQTPTPTPAQCPEQFILLKQIFLNITAKGTAPQTEVMTAITVDTKDRYYNAWTVDMISGTKLTEAEELTMEQHIQERKQLRDNPLSLNETNKARLTELDRLVEQDQRKVDRLVICAQAEAEFPEIKYKAQTPQEILPAPLADDTMVKYKAGVQYGVTCENDKKIQILARVEKSEQQRIQETKASQGERTTEEAQCELDRQAGDKYTVACKKVTEQRATLRAAHIEVTTKIGATARAISGVVGEAIVKIMRQLGWVTQLNVINEQKKMLISVDQDINGRDATVSVKAPMRNVKAQLWSMEKLPALYNPMKPVTHAIADMFLGQAKPRCKVTSNDKVKTFMDTTFNYELSKCFHILAKDCSATERFLVLARKIQAGQPEKEVIVHHAGHKILIHPHAVDGLQVLIDDVNWQVGVMDKVIMREDGTIEKENVLTCKRRTLIDVIIPGIAENGFTSSEIYRLLMHKERHKTSLARGQPSPRHASDSNSHRKISASHSHESLSISLHSTSSEEAMMRIFEKDDWKQMREVMKLSFEGHEQRQIMQMLNISLPLSLKDGFEFVLDQPTSRPVIMILRTSKSVSLYDFRLGLFVHTCGQNVKVEIARHFQDFVCGMCGHFNGEVKDELRGPSMEIYKEPKQFALTYQLQSVPQECAQECVPRVNIEKQDLTVDNVDSSCYSKVLIPRCQTPCRAVETKQVKTAFVCIARTSGLKAQLDDSIQRQRPHEVVRTLSSKGPSFVEAIDVHTRCQK